MRPTMVTGTPYRANDKSVGREEIKQKAKAKMKPVQGQMKPVQGLLSCLSRSLTSVSFFTASLPA